MKLPLEGIRVISMTEVWAGPFATTMLGDMGADVLHIEAIQRVAQSRGQIRPAPGTGNYADGDPGQRPWERLATFNHTNRNKKGVTIDLTRPQGLAILKELVKISDILIDNYAAGTLPRMGLGYEVLSEVNPGLIMLSMSGWGLAEPYKGYISFGSHVDAMTGHTWLRGYPDADPTLSSSIVHSDAVCAAMAAFAVQAALVARRRTGKGQFIDMSQAEALMTHLGEYYLDYSVNGRAAQPIGNKHPTMAPHGVYPCRGHDRWLTLAVGSDAEFAALCAVIGRPELADDDRFADVVSRHANQDELDAIITAWSREQEDADAVERLQAAGVTAGMTQNDRDLYHDPQLLARGFFEEVNHPQVGPRLQPGVFWRLSKSNPHIRLHAPTLGGYNDYLYRELLGYDEATYFKLKEDLILGDTYLEGAELSGQDRAREEARARG